MAPASSRNAVPKPDWYCKFCSGTRGKQWKVRGVFNHCRDCNSKKGDCFSHNVPPSSPSSSRVHPPRPGSAGNGNLSWAERVSKENEALKKELAAQKKQRKIAAAAVPQPAASDDADMDAGEVVEVFKRSVKGLRVLMQSSIEDGCDPDTDVDIIRW